MKIAICDDDSLVLQELSSLLNEYRAKSHTHLEYEKYSCPLELLAQLEKGAHFDIILLDVVMPGINGIQCAKDIRAIDNFVKIIFLTSSPEYAVESYSVSAYQYLLKPLQKEKLFSIIDLLEGEVDAQSQNVFVFKSQKGITKISLSKLEYCEVSARKLVLHMVNGEEYECNLHMNELEEYLKVYKMFLKPHRSFLVNMDYIKTLMPTSIVMECGAKLPIPKEKHNHIKQSYMDYIFQSSIPNILGH